MVVWEKKTGCGGKKSGCGGKGTIWGIWGIWERSEKTQGKKTYGGKGMMTFPRSEGRGDVKT